MAYGIAKFKKRYQKVSAFTRAHGWDVYFERQRDDYLPMKMFIIDQLDVIFFVSNHGKEYLMNKLKLDNNIKKLKVSRLGVDKRLQMDLFRERKPFRFEKRSNYKIKKKCIKIISCSGIIPLKRIDLIIKTLARIKDCNIEWTHIGHGNEKRNIEKLAFRLLGKKDNIDYKFLGKITNKNVMKFYKNNNIDIFMNLSEFEGIPVTMMEAMSLGIPVIATDVGGVSEIFTDENGVLLPPNPEIEEIKSAIDKFYYMDKETFNTYRRNAYHTWKENYNANVNYPEFITQVINLKSNN